MGEGTGSTTPWAGSAEGEHVGLDAGGEEADLERAVGDRSLLTNELVEPLLDDGAVALLVHVEPVRVTWWLAVEEHAERHARVARGRAQHEVDVASVEAVADAAAGPLEDARPLRDGPLSAQRPLVELQHVGCGEAGRLADRRAVVRDQA